MLISVIWSFDKSLNSWSLEIEQKHLGFLFYHLLSAVNNSEMLIASGK